jgi:hypothetical protein
MSMKNHQYNIQEIIISGRCLQDIFFRAEYFEFDAR